MTTAFLIWAYLGLGNFIIAMWVITVFTSIGFVFWYVRRLINIDYNTPRLEEPAAYAELHKKARSIYPYKTLFVFILITTFYPSISDLKYIIGGTVLIEGGKMIADSKEAQKLPDNIIKAANTFLTKVNDEKKKSDKSE